jgi:hypothetical protein
MNDTARKPDGTGLAGWLRSTVTLSLPGWAFAAGAIALVLIVIIALE